MGHVVQAQPGAAAQGNGVSPLGVGPGHKKLLVGGDGAAIVAIAHGKAIQPEAIDGHIWHGGNGEGEGAAGLQAAAGEGQGVGYGRFAIPTQAAHIAAIKAQVERVVRICLQVGEANGPEG